MIIDIVNKSKHPLPAIATPGSSGLDLKANLEQDICIKPLERVAIATGLFLSIPLGYEGQIRSRSGLSFNHGIIVINAPGTIDSDYRGELKILLINLSNENFTVHDGDRVAQLVISFYTVPEWNVVINLDKSLRADKGFGSTGL
ncbi:MAG: dUTP diphosphatase [Cytophagales bacterium]|jgi:dUTP pyrophosphatase|nr:dUTP diphosphatase [Cytophagales bacterium]